MTIQPEEELPEDTTIGVGCEEAIGSSTQPRLKIETEDNAADVFVHTFISTVHQWVVGGAVLLMFGAFLALMGVV